MDVVRKLGVVDGRSDNSLPPTPSSTRSSAPSSAAAVIAAARKLTPSSKGGSPLRAAPLPTLS
eukprot:398482-Prorocentrum_minimum.AAC.1